MKNTIQLLFFLSLFAGCNSGSSSGLTSGTTNDGETSSLVSQIQGNYRSCAASLLYPTYYSQINFSVSGNRVVKTHTLSAISNCSSPYYEFETTWDISKARTHSVTPTKIEVDYSVVSYRFKALHAYYVSQNYCGVSNWVVGVFAEVTGLDCPVFNPSPAGTTFLSQGDMEYETLELGTNAISVIGKENEVGHSDGQRRETGLVQLLKY